jgi:hypothetical protein
VGSIVVARVRYRGIATTTIIGLRRRRHRWRGLVWLAGMSCLAAAKRLRARPAPGVARGRPHARSVSTLTAAELCAGTRTSRTVTDQVRRDVLARYGMEHTPSDRYELDALVTLELGGTVEPSQPVAAALRVHALERARQGRAGTSARRGSV